MGWLIAVVLVPLAMMLAGVYVVARLAILMLRVFFAPVVWLAERPTRQRVELRHSVEVRHYDGD